MLNYPGKVVKELNYVNSLIVVELDLQILNALIVHCGIVNTELLKYLQNIDHIVRRGILVNTELGNAFICAFI